MLLWQGLVQLGLAQGNFDILHFYEFNRTQVGESLLRLSQCLSCSGTWLQNACGFTPLHPLLFLFCPFTTFILGLHLSLLKIKGLVCGHQARASNGSWPHFPIAWTRALHMCTLHKRFEFQYNVILVAGHYLGMDVHDCSTVSLDLPLKPGVVRNPVQGVL